MSEAILQIQIDLGTSLTCCFWKLKNDRGILKGFKTIASSTSECTQLAYERSKLADSGTTYVRADEEYWIVGTNAMAICHRTISSEPKSYAGPIKVLAAIGQILKEIPSELQLNVEIKLLLPLDELGQADELSDRIARLVYQFGIDGKEIQLGVRSVRIFPEGYGLVQWVKTDPAMVLVFGHRDVTVLRVEGDRIVLHKSKTFAEFGMLNLLRQIDYPLKDELSAAAAIFKAKENMDHDALKSLCIESDLPLLKSLIHQARQVSWRQIVRELQGVGLASVLQVLATGRNAYYWEAELKELAPGRVSFCKPQIKEMTTEYGVPKNSLMYKGLDSYGLMSEPSNVGGIIYA